MVEDGVHSLLLGVIGVASELNSREGHFAHLNVIVDVFSEILSGI